MKNLVTVKTFFEYIYSDENSEGVTISEKSIEKMNDLVFQNLQQLFLDCKILPYRLIHDWTSKEEQQGDFETKNLKLVKSIKVYQ